MSGSRRASDAIAGVVAILAAALAAPAFADGPKRVVSMNLCTDQLAMLLAAPGQLVSVTYLARDPRLSAMVDQAMDYPVNRGGAEELFLMRPDVVLADEWSPGATISMLRRVGIEVVQFSPGTTMDEVRTNILKMGEVLGREPEAEALSADYAAALSVFRAYDGPRPRAALYFANGYMAGVNSLSGRIVEAAGFDNIAGERGLEYGAAVPLEELVMAAPDLVIVAGREPGQSRAEEVLGHPALRHMNLGADLTDADWTCATPHVLKAVGRLAEVRKTLTEPAP